MSDNPYGASAVSRAMAGSSQENAAEAVGARRVMDDRDFDREAQASALYFNLRVLTKEQLIEICQEHGFYADGAMGRQALIASIIDGLLLSPDEADKMGPTHHPKEEA